jgi:hypothetical protein
MKVKVYSQQKNNSLDVKIKMILNLRRNIKWQNM